MRPITVPRQVVHQHSSGVLCQQGPNSYRLHTEATRTSDEENIQRTGFLAESTRIARDLPVSSEIAHEPEVHAGYRNPSSRWLCSDDPRKPIRKTATPSTGRPRLARSRRRGRNASRSASRSRRRCRRAAPSRCDGRPPVKAGKTARIIASALKFARVILDKTPLDQTLKNRFPMRR